MKRMQIKPKQKAIHSAFFDRESGDCGRWHGWGVVRLLVLIFLLSGLVLTATGAWSSDQDYLRAEKLYQANQISAAEQLYSQVGPDDANYTAAQYRLGAIYYGTGRPALAEKCFSICLRVKKSPEVYCRLAGAQFDQKEYDRAANSAQQALQLDPKYAKAYTLLGMIHAGESEFPQADADYRAALKLNDHDSDTWFWWGLALLYRDDFAAAANAFEHALSLDPSSVRSYENLARAKDALGDLKGAEDCYQHGLQLTRTPRHFNPDIYVAYGEFLLKLNRLADSRSVVEEALRTAPERADLHQELSKVCFRMNRLEEAAHEGETALRLGGPNYKVDFLLAQIYTAMGNSEEAAKYASLAAQAPPNPDR
jgi:tetratricopeptide (TPR) repeat protein